MTVTRRHFLRASGAGLAATTLAPWLRWMPGDSRALAAASAGRFFEPAEYATIDAATARLIPDDLNPDGTPSPGARPARVVDYIDRFLGAFEGLAEEDTPFIYAGGPRSDRNPVPDPPGCDSVPTGTTGSNPMATPVPLSRRREIAWRARIQGTASLGPEAEFIRINNGGEIVGYQEVYRQGIKELNDFSNQLFGADFTALQPPQQDIALNLCPNQDFVGLLFEQTVEGMYANPEYGGNQPPNPGPATGADGDNRPVGWSYIGFEGDRQPLGYTIFVPDPQSPSEGSYCELPDHPMSGPNPTSDPLPLDLWLRAELPGLIAKLRVRR